MKTSRVFTKKQVAALDEDGAFYAIGYLKQCIANERGELQNLNEYQAGLIAGYEKEIVYIKDVHCII